MTQPARWAPLPTDNERTLLEIAAVPGEVGDAALNTLTHLPLRAEAWVRVRSLLRERLAVTGQSSERQRFLWGVLRWVPVLEPADAVLVERESNSNDGAIRIVRRDTDLAWIRSPAPGCLLIDAVARKAAVAAIAPDLRALAYQLEEDGWRHLRVDHELASGEFNPVAVTVLFEYAGSADHYQVSLCNALVAKIARNIHFSPDLIGLFQLYRRAMTRYAKYVRRPFGPWLLDGRDDESGLAWLSWQLAWAASRGGIVDIVAGMLPSLTSADPEEQIAAVSFVADAADYCVQPEPEFFGGGRLPPRLAQDDSLRVFPDHPPQTLRRDPASKLEPAREDSRLYEVWFGTNRACNDLSVPSKGFSNKRDEEGKVHYGTCMVEVPRSHRFGSTGTPFYKRWRRLEFKDDHLTLRTIRPIDDEDSFIREMRIELEAQPESDRVALVYLHGYNTSFEEAAIRAAQIGLDLKVPGVTAFYSWPSMAAAKGYAADIARVEASEAQLAEFLSVIATRSGAKVVHVLAHSMGNRGFARAVSRITSSAASAGAVRFGQILLAAPDIDVDLFKALAVAYPRIAMRTTMYVSAKDRALEMSSWLQDSSRAGFTPPVTVVDGIETIEVGDVDLTLLGHSYYAEAEAVLYDMKQLLDSDDPKVPPERRPRIEKRERGGLKY